MSVKDIINNICNKVDSIIDKMDKSAIICILMGVIISVLCASFMGSFCLIVPLILGIGREYLDRWRGDNFNKKDLLWTVVGGIIGAIISLPLI